MWTILHILWGIIHILNTTFEVIKIEKRKYWNENGCRAFRRQLVSDIRENNVIM